MRICPQCGERTEARVCVTDGYRTVNEDVISGANDPLLGTVFEGRYRIESILGRGGMGTVYRGTQLTVERPVAIKVLNADRVTDLTTIARFQQEARSVAALRHPNTIRLIDFGQSDDGTLFLVMEFLDGEPLRGLIKREAPLDPERVIHIGCQVLEGLAEAHNVGIVHRDLKPDNLFVSELFGRSDFVKILDFGIAKVTGFGKDTTLTGAGVALGSPRYIAPEQASAGPVDARADLYALGVVLYEMLSGEAPFVCGSVAEYMLAHVELEVPPLHIDGHVATGRLPELIYACLAKQPMHRPRGASELLEMLQACAGAPFEAAPVRPACAAPPTETDTSAVPVRLARAAPENRDNPPQPTAVETTAADDPPEDQSAWPGAPSRGQAATAVLPAATLPPQQLRPPTGGPRASQTGLAPRSHRVVPPPPDVPSSNSSSVVPLALAAVLLIGLGGGGAWWVSHSTSAADSGPSGSQATASPGAEVASEAVVRPTTAVAAPSEASTVEDDAPPTPGDDVVMLVTVPEGATVKRGDVELGKTPFALVWDGSRDQRALEIIHEGYERERLRYSDLGGSARYELYLRPEGAARSRTTKRPIKRRTQRTNKAGGQAPSSKAVPSANAIEKPSVRVPESSPPAPTANPKARVYEELD